MRRIQAPSGNEKVSSIPEQGKLELSPSSNEELSKTDDVKQSESSKDAPVLMQKLSSALPSSSLHLEELVTPTVAPATPSFDTESTATLITGSSFASNPQTNGHVASSVILIPPNNSGQVQSSDSINGLKERSPFEPVPTKGPEALISVLDTGPPNPISKAPVPTPPTPAALVKEDKDSITADLNQAEEESKPKEEEMPSFDEFKRRVLQEEEEKSKQQTAQNASGPTHKPKPKRVKERKQSNYASVDCGAKILDHNEEASNADSILMENKDLYMLNPCSAKVWFIVELCDVAQVKSIQIANFELFSSTPESFSVYVSTRYPTREWTMLGTFEAREERTVQTFPLDEPIYAKYLKVEMLSHFGSEHYCPLSLLRVHGSSMMEELEDHETDGQDDSDNSDSEQDIPVLPSEPGAKAEDELKKPNFLERAADTVMNIVKKIAGKEEGNRNGSEKGEQHDDSIKSVTNGGTASSEIESKHKHKIVTLVGQEELEENPVENKTNNDSDIGNKKLPIDKGMSHTQERKPMTVNSSSPKTSLCEDMESGSESKTTCPVLTRCQSFAQVIGQYCLGCFMGRLMFSKNSYKDSTFLRTAVKDRRTVLSPVQKLKFDKKEDEFSGSQKQDEQGEREKHVVQDNIKEKKSVSESIMQHNVPSKEENPQSSVNIPSSSSTNWDGKSGVPVFMPLNIADNIVSSEIVKPSHSGSSLAMKSDIPDIKTPSLVKVSVASEAPLNSALSSSSSSPTYQSSELSVVKEPEANYIQEPADAKKMQNVKEQTTHGSLLATSLSSTLDREGASSVQKDGFKEVPESVQSDMNSFPKAEEKREPDMPDELGGYKDNEVHATPTECKSPNSLHTVPFSSPDIDVLETKLTDKEGREGTAQLREETQVEKDYPLSNEKSDSKENEGQVTDFSNKIIESEGLGDKGILPNMESQGSAGTGESTTSTAVGESQSVNPTAQPCVGSTSDPNDQFEAVLPSPAPPVASSSNQESISVASSDTSLDATMLSRAQQHVSGSSAGVASVVGSGVHKESIFVRLSNKIKALEQNLNMSTLYMEQLNQRYRKSLDDLQKNSDKKVALLTNATKKAENVINNQKEQIAKLQSEVDNLTSMMVEMKARMDPLNKEVMERHVIGLFIEIALILLLFFVFTKRNNNNNNNNIPEALRESEHFLNGKGPPRLAIEDDHNKTSIIHTTASLSGREQLLRSFGKPPEPESVGSSNIADGHENKLNKTEPFNSNEGKKKRNRKRKGSSPEPPPDSPSCADTPSPGSFLSRTAGLLFLSARGLFGGFHNPWKLKKPSTVHSDPVLSTRSGESLVSETQRLRPPVLSRARSLDSVPEETPSQRIAPPPPPPPLPPEFGVAFKRPPDCSYSKKTSVRNITPGPKKYGKYGVLDSQLA